MRRLLLKKMRVGTGSYDGEEFHTHPAQDHSRKACAIVIRYAPGSGNPMPILSKLGSAPSVMKQYPGAALVALPEGSDLEIWEEQVDPAPDTTHFKEILSSKESLTRLCAQSADEDWKQTSAPFSAEALGISPQLDEMLHERVDRRSWKSHKRIELEDALLAAKYDHVPELTQAWLDIEAAEGPDPSAECVAFCEGRKRARAEYDGNEICTAWWAFPAPEGVKEDPAAASLLKFRALPFKMREQMIRCFTREGVVDVDAPCTCGHAMNDRLILADYSQGRPRSTCTDCLSSWFTDFRDHPRISTASMGFTNAIFTHRTVGPNGCGMNYVVPAAIPGGLGSYHEAILFALDPCPSCGGDFEREVPQCLAGKRIAFGVDWNVVESQQQAQSELSGLQLAVNKLLRDIQRAQNLIVGHYLIENSADVNTAGLNSGKTSMVEWDVKNQRWITPTASKNDDASTMTSPINGQDGDRRT